MIRPLPLLTIATIALFAVSSHARAAIKTETVEYKAGDKTLKGFIAYDDATTDKRPAVIVVPEWWGMTDYPKMRARKLAELGYVGFAADFYGDGKTTDDPKQAGQWAGEVKGNPDLEKQLAQAAIDEVKKHPQVDPDKIAAIGYCFGGTMALDMVRRHEPVKGVVSFHGDLSTNTPSKDTGAAKVLVCTGAADSFVPPQSVDAFRKEMPDAKVISYPGAHHSFTNPDADRHHIDNIKYNEAADKKSWEDMKQFLTELFGK